MRVSSAWGEPWVGDVAVGVSGGEARRVCDGRWSGGFMLSREVLVPMTCQSDPSLQGRTTLLE